MSRPSKSHTFIQYDEECECSGCFCKPWHNTAEYECGLGPKGWKITDTGVFPVWFNDEWED